MIFIRIFMKIFGRFRKPVRLLLLGACSAIVLMGLLLIPNLIGFLPSWLVRHPLRWLIVALLVGHSLIPLTAWRDVSGADRLAWLVRTRRWLESPSKWALERGLTVGF